MVLVFSLERLSLMIFICSSVIKVTPFDFAHSTQPFKGVGRKIRGTLTSMEQASSVNFILGLSTFLKLV